jgi:ferric-dicitrate binding protein FerR (iron transport regulator)
MFSTLWPPLIGAAIAIAGLAVAWKPGVFRGSERTHAVSTYVTGNGQRANITLTDGSTVALGVASRLEVPADYSAGNHTLRLHGEALFTVAHHSNVPFTVIAGRETARVLGTSFVVRHYANDTTTTVAVRDGKVMVHSVILTAARQATIDRRGGVYVRSVDPAVFSFASGVLTLNSLSLSDAIPALDRWYDVDVRLGDSTLVTKRITGDLPVGSVADLISLLQVEMRVVRDGQILTLFPK